MCANGQKGAQKGHQSKIFVCTYTKETITQLLMRKKIHTFKSLQFSLRELGNKTNAFYHLYIFKWKKWNLKCFNMISNMLYKKLPYSL